MKRKRKKLALFIALCFLIAFMPGCGDTVDTVEEPEDSGAPSPAVTGTQGAIIEENALDAIDNDDGIIDSGNEGIQYVDVILPLTDGDVTLSIFAIFPPPLAAFLNSCSERAVYEELAKRSGVKLEFTDAMSTGAIEQLSIMLASGDMNDFISGFGNLHTASVDSAVEEGIIVDLRPYLEDYMPNYYATLSYKEEFMKNVVTDSGYVVCAAQITESSYISGGLVIRQDWLDELELKTPQTYDDFYNVLTAFKIGYGAEPLYMLSTGGLAGDTLSAGFGVATNFQDVSSEIGFYQVDGVVKFGPTEDGFKDYVRLMAQWYSEGLIWQEFYTDTSRREIPEYPVSNEILAVFPSGPDTIGQYEGYISDVSPNVRLVAVGAPRKDTSEKNHLCSITTSIDRGGGMYISTDCENIELACMMLDYFYSQEGTLLCNWGIENVSFEYGKDGKPHFTELLTNNPEGMAYIFAKMRYTMGQGSFYRLMDALYDTYDEDQLAMSDIWAEASDSEYVIANFITLTADEQSRLTTILGDLITYYNENLAQFIAGLKPLSELDGFVGQMENMGVDECIGIYQAAWDRYLAK